ncbi:MAG: GNAT family N-acetyltransferase [Butyrivibrio sp.]|nr:GNAT family N-acetyltransferase [Butyrivibrio sp.]
MIEYIRIIPDNAVFFRHLMREDAYLYIPDPGTIGIGLAEDSQPFAALVFRVPEEGRAQVLSLYVQKNYRRQGYGTELMVTMADYLEAFTEVTRVDCDYDLRNDTESALPAFLAYLDFDVQQAPGGCYVTTLGQLRQIRGLQGGGGSCIPYAEMSILQKKMLYQEELDLKPEMDAGLIEESMSCVRMEGDTIEGCLIFVRDEQDPGALNLLWARNNRYPAGMASLLGSALQGASAYGDDTRLIIPVMNERSERLAAGILGDRAQKTETVWHATLALYGDGSAEEELETEEVG